MKKKLLSVILVVALMASTLTACGEKEENKDDKVVENVQEDNEEGETEDRTEDKTTDSNVVDLGNGMMMEYPGGDDGLIEMEGEVTIIEEDEDVQVSADSEWATAYEDYFAREDILPQNMKLLMNTNMEGITMDIVVATVGDSTYMRYAFDTAALDLYATADKVYACTEIAGEESWIYAPVASAEDVDSVMSLAGENTIVEPENVTSCTYVKEVEENGVIYDVLFLEVEDESTLGEVFYYVNRETQKVDKFTMEQDGQLIECYVEEINSIEIPAEASNATEGTMEDVAGALFAVIFSAMDVDIE